MPSIVIAGRGIANGVVEVRNRLTGTSEELAVGDAVAAVLTHARTE
jgi:prolyl-tRNA synthetase